MMEFLDATGMHRVTVGAKVMVKAIEGFYDLVCVRAYWDVSCDVPCEYVKLRGKSGKTFDRVAPGEVAVCIEYFGGYYVPLSFVGDDYAPKVGWFVLVWSDKLHMMVYCEVMEIDGDIVKLRYGKVFSERKTTDCFVELERFKEECAL